MNSRQWNHEHQARRIKKLEKIQTLRALLDMWEERPDEVEREYLLALRARLRSAENQYAAMRP